MRLDKKFKASAFYLIGNLFDKAIAFITVPIFTRMLSTDEYGILNTYLSWVSIFAIVVGLSLGQTLRSAYYEKKDTLEGYLSSIYTLAILDFVVSLVVVLVLSFFVDFQITRMMLVLCLTQSFFQFVRDTYAMKLMMSMDYVKRTLILAIPNVLVALLSVVFIWQMDSQKHMGRIIAYVLVYALIGLVCMVSQYRRGKTVVSIDNWKYGLSLSLPLILHSFSCVILSNSDRIMITKYAGSTETAIYSLVYNLSLMMTVITSSFENVWIPWFSDRMHKEETENINRAVGPYILGGAVLTVGVMFVAPEAIWLLAPEEYWSGKLMVPPLVASVYVMFLYTISVNLEYYKKSTGTIARNTIVAAVSNLILNYIFIPRFGAVAAAYTTLASYTVSLALHYLDGKRLSPELFPLKHYLIPTLVVAIASFAYYPILNLWYVRWVLAAGLAGVALAYMWKKGLVAQLISRK